MKLTDLDKAVHIALELLPPDAKHRLKDILVEEVSIVDRAANKRRFLLVKRAGGGDAMKLKLTEKMKAAVGKDVTSVLERMVKLASLINDAETAEDGADILSTEANDELKSITSALNLVFVSHGIKKSETVEEMVKNLVAIAEMAMGLAEEVAVAGEVDDDLKKKMSDMNGLVGKVTGAQKSEPASEPEPTPATEPEPASADPDPAADPTEGGAADDPEPNPEDVEKAAPNKDMDREKLMDMQKQRASQFGIEVLSSGSNLSFPKNYPTKIALYGDPVNLKYPLDTPAHARNARVRFKTFAASYKKTSSKRIIHERIVRAELKHGIKVNIDPNDALDKLLPKDLRDKAERGSAKKSEADFQLESMETNEILESLVAQVASLTESVRALQKTDTQDPPPEPAPEPATEPAPESTPTEPEPASTEPAPADPPPEPATNNQNPEDNVTQEEKEALEKENAELKKVNEELKKSIDELKASIETLEKSNKELEVKLKKAEEEPPTRASSSTPVDKGAEPTVFPQFYGNPTFDNQAASKS